MTFVSELNVFVVGNISVIDAIVSATQIVLSNDKCLGGVIFWLTHIKSDRHHF